MCDYPLGLAGLDQYRAQHESLVRIDLERYAARLEQAQRDCKDRFRKDILFRMKDDIFNARRQFRELNKVMEQLQQAYLSRVSRDSSGGENQAPFYVAICASLCCRSRKRARTASVLCCWTKPSAR